MRTASKSKAAHANYATPNGSPYVTNMMLLNFLPSKQQLLLLKMNTAYQALGLIRVALLLYPPPTRPLGPLPAPYPIPRGNLIHTGQKIK